MDLFVHFHFNHYQKHFSASTSFFHSTYISAVNYINNYFTMPYFAANPKLTKCISWVAFFARFWLIFFGFLGCHHQYQLTLVCVCEIYILSIISSCFTHKYIQWINHTTMNYHQSTLFTNVIHKLFNWYYRPVSYEIYDCCILIFR